MGYLLQDRIEFSLFIGDNEYPLDAFNLLESLHIGGTVRGSLPILSLAVNDVRHVLDNIGLQDGIPIRVSIKPDGKATQIYRFRKFSHQRLPNGSSFRWLINGYWDAPLFWASTSALGFEGTSDNVLQDIASKCGLQYDGTPTNDSQIWMPRNQFYRAWARDVTDHGYVDDTSCMVLGTDLDGTLRYKNVNNLPNPTKKITAYQTEQGATTAMDVVINANSGLNNVLTGYQNIRYSQSSTSDDPTTSIQDLTFTPDSRSPLFNKELKDRVGRGPVRFGPISPGNVHENYEKAAYQNLRYRNLFNLGLDLLIPVPTDFKLCEQFTLSVHHEDTSTDMVNSGTYTITGHSIYIQGATYAERLGVARHGTNENYKGG